MKELNILKMTDDLRKNAEKLLNEKENRHEAFFPETFNLRLIHELKIHQIELELQNEELSLAKEKAELAEEKYTELYDFAPIGYLSLTKEGDIVDLNISAEHLLGKDRLSLMNSRFGFFVVTDVLHDYNDFIEKLIQTNLKQTCELKLVVDNDVIKNVLVSGIINSTKQKCLLTLTDITAQKKVEIELIEAREKAEESDRLKSAFLANVSHEIRTPMNGILGFTELLQSMKLSGKEKHDYLQIIEKSGIRMLNIINDIITISRIESEQVKVEVSNTNVNEMMKDIYNFFEPEAKQKKLQILIKNTLPANDPFIVTDNEKLYAVLTNLVKNAIKFTQTGTVEFGCETKGRYVEFFVKDSGVGISDEQKEHIFERFWQGRELLTSNHAGSGLGLAISKAYIELLGGEIWLQSVVGQGSTFRFTLPEFNEIHKKEKRKIDLIREPNPSLKLKILVVDDDETSQMLLSEMFKTYEFEITHVSSGQDAVIACQNNPDFDLVLMDMKLQGMDGYEATRRIREFNKKVVIFAQTAFVLDGDREKALNAGCNNYISKPIKRTELMDLITRYMG